MSSGDETIVDVELPDVKPATTEIESQEEEDVRRGPFMNLRRRFKKRSRKQKPKEPIWVPRNWGLGSFFDFWKGFWKILIDNKITIFCVAIPLAFAAQYAPWSPDAVFVLCMISIIPLAKLLGEATEELAIHTNQIIGGLLNATFGNAVELIVAIVALKQRLPIVVQASLLGSILSNLLLVLGMSFFFGGLKYKIQRFNVTAAQTSSSLLILAVMAILFPAAFFLSGSTDPSKLNQALLELSRGTSIIILIIYVCYLIFQLKTHSFLYQDETSKKDGKGSEKVEDGSKKVEDGSEKVEDESNQKQNEDENDDDEEHPRLPIWGSIFLLAAVTVLVSVLSEYLVDSIQSVTAAWNVSETFVGIILLPIVGNAAEHVTSVTCAMKNKMDLSISVALGSSIQIALLVIPLLVLLGWIIDSPLSLYFYTFETVALFVSVIIVNAVIADGESHWLEGSLLLATYFIIALGFYYHV